MACQAVAVTGNGAWRWWPTVGRSGARGLAGAGACWAALFAVAHFYWAAGGRVGVPTGTGDIGLRPAFLAYDLVSGVVFALAAGIGAFLSARPGRAPSWLVTLTACGAVLGLLRGLVGVVQDIAAVAAGRSLTTGAIYDCWFLVAGLVFCTVANSLRR